MVARRILARAGGVDAIDDDPLRGDAPGRAWLVVAMASALAGNLTIVGSVANLIVSEAARRARIDIGFLEYCRVGVCP